MASSNGGSAAAAAASGAPETQNFFTKMPQELLHSIEDYLDEQSLRRLRLVSKQFNRERTAKEQEERKNMQDRLTLAEEVFHIQGWYYQGITKLEHWHALISLLEMGPAPPLIDKTLLSSEFHSTLLNWNVLPSDEEELYGCTLECRNLDFVRILQWVVTPYVIDHSQSKKDELAEAMQCRITIVIEDRESLRLANILEHGPFTTIKQSKVQKTIHAELFPFDEDDKTVETATVYWCLREDGSEYIFWQHTYEPVWSSEHSLQTYTVARKLTGKDWVFITGAGKAVFQLLYYDITHTNDQKESKQTIVLLAPFTDNCLAV